MNNFQRYSFSVEVKDNLADFLRVAQKTPSNTYDKIWESLLPKNEKLINELNAHLARDEMIVDLTDEDSLSKKQDAICATTEDTLDDNVLSLSNDFKEKLNSTSIKNLADSLKECLRCEENLDDIFQDIISNYKDEITDIFSLLFESLNSELICKFGICILNMRDKENSEIIRFYIKYLLIPKLFTVSNKQVDLIFIKFLESSLIKVISDEFSHKLNNDTIESPKYFLNTLNRLETKHKQHLLRGFVMSTSKLHHSHFSIIDALLHKDLQIEILRRMMELLSTVMSTCSDDKIFGKMLLNVIKCAGNNIMHFRQQITTIVGAHRSVWKHKLQKEIDCFDNDYTLSESLRY